jgi:hypothetical protein
MSVLVPPCVFDKVAAILAQGSVSEFVEDRAIAMSTLRALSRTSRMLYGICTFPALPVRMGVKELLRSPPDGRANPIWCDVRHMVRALKSDQGIPVEVTNRIEGILCDFAWDQHRVASTDAALEFGDEGGSMGPEDPVRIPVVAPRLKFLQAVCSGRSTMFPRTLTRAHLDLLFVSDAGAVIAALPAKTLRMLQLENVSFRPDVVSNMERGEAKHVMASLRQFECNMITRVYGEGIEALRVIAMCKRAHTIKFGVSKHMDVVRSYGFIPTSGMKLPSLRNLCVDLNTPDSDFMTAPCPDWIPAAEIISTIVAASPIIQTVSASGIFERSGFCRHVGLTIGCNYVPPSVSSVCFDIFNDGKGKRRVVPSELSTVSSDLKKIVGGLARTTPWAGGSTITRLRRVALVGCEDAAKTLLHAPPGLRSVKLHDTKLGEMPACENPWAWAARLDELEISMLGIYQTTRDLVLWIEMLSVAMPNVHTLTLGDWRVIPANVLASGAPRLRVLKLTHCAPTAQFCNAVAQGAIPHLVQFECLNQRMRMGPTVQVIVQMVRSLAACPALAVVNILPYSRHPRVAKELKALEKRLSHGDTARAKRVRRPEDTAVFRDMRTRRPRPAARGREGACDGCRRSGADEDHACCILANGYVCWAAKRAPTGAKRPLGDYP